VRVAVGGICQEVNPQNPVTTTVENFVKQELSLSQDILTRNSGVYEIGGFMKAAQEEGDVELVPTLYAWTLPSGLVERGAYQYLKSGLLQELRKAGKLDGILLSFHGSMAAEGEDDVEGDVLQAIRAEWGEEITIAITLDHHANITKTMVRSVDVLVGYHTCPHTDQFETGYKAAKILFSAVRNGVRPTIGWRKLPLFSMGDMVTTGGPLKEFFEQAEAGERLAGVLAVSIFLGFACIDLAELGWAVTVVTDGFRSLAQSMADRLAEEIWERRAELDKKEGVSPAEAVRAALEVEGGPVVLSDRADSVAAGAPGDGTAILRELLGQDLGGKALVTVTDPEAVSISIAAGVGETVTLDVGGKIDRVNNRPVRVSARVRLVSDGRYEPEDMAGKGIEANIGRTVVLQAGNVYMLVSELPQDTIDPAVYRSVGLEPTVAKIVVVKSFYHFRHTYERFAKAIILVDGPGVASRDPEWRRELLRLARPIWPLDPDVTLDDARVRL
jgi:microcystin degradation protein MlrC